MLCSLHRHVLYVCKPIYTTCTCRYCRQQVPAALTVIDAGLASYRSKEQPGYSTIAAHCRVLLCSFHILLLRVKAQLLLALADANGALAVLGSAKQRLSNARQSLADRQDAAAEVAALKQQEAQVVHTTAGI